MKKTRYTEEQIAFALKQAETGICVGEVCRKMGISEAIFIIRREIRCSGRKLNLNCVVCGNWRMKISG
ncbi:transposase [Klebsiella pneumoniae]|nr:transposase [Klebsiella pneumoniae]